MADGFGGQWEAGRDMDAASDKSATATTASGHLSQYTGNTSTTFYPPVDFTGVILALMFFGYLFYKKGKI